MRLFVEETQFTLATPCFLGTSALRRGQLARHDGCHQEHTQREQIFNFENDKRVQRGNEEVVEGEHGQQRRQARGIEPTGTG